MEISSQGKLKKKKKKVVFLGGFDSWQNSILPLNNGSQTKGKQCYVTPTYSES